MNSKAVLSERSRFVGVANFLLPLAYAGRLLDRPELDADAIVQTARDQSGLSDFGSEWFRKPLAVLVDALKEEAALNRLGVFAAVGQNLKVLKDRLRAEALIAAHPQIENRSLKSPIVVIGPMRSGTTRLHRLLSADDRFAHMRMFEAVNPVPAVDFEPGDRDLRWIGARAIMGSVHTFNPNTACIHPTGPFEPEEELGLLVRSIWGMKHEAQWHVPSYGRWSETQDATPAYEYMARLLRLIGWARGDDDSRPWVLKTPQHMLDLPALLRVFPDARLIFTHREPRAVVGSSCSLVWNQMIIHSDRVDADTIGTEWLSKTELQVERMRQARIGIPESQRIDVRYADMEADWSGTMRRIYQFLGMDMQPAVPAMRSYMAEADRKLHRHPHRYSLEAFGLTPGLVQERFGSYIEAFDLPVPDAMTGSAQTIDFPDAAPRLPSAGARDWQKAGPTRAAAARN